MSKTAKIIINVLAIVAIVAVLIVAKFTGAQPNTFWGLVPPIIAIGLALITKEAYSSLFIGIVSGALMVSKFSFAGTIDTIINDGLIGAVKDTAGIFVFLVLLGVIVALLNKTGGSQAFGKWAEKHVKTRAGAMLATFALGVLIFVDDYFNCLTVGSVMRPVCDSKKISRAKLAYIIDATAAPICMIAPISSWAAAVASYTEGTDYSGIELFVRAIPYNFYSILTLVFVVALVLLNFDYGSMRIHEANALLRGDLYTSGDKNEGTEIEATGKGKVIDLILPVIILIVTCVIGLLYVGGFGKKNIIDAFGDTDATVGLPWGALIALVIIIIYLIARRLVSFKEAMECIPKGFIAMVPAIIILTLAVSLKSVTGLLGADVFVEGVVKGSAANFAMFLPAIIFLVACVLAFSTGTSWGTFGILIPIVISIFEPGSQLMIVGMSACLAGAVCGDHCSPISDTTIMSSAGGQCNHINHVSTQMPYAISVAAISFVLYVLIGILEAIGLGSFIWITIPLGVVITVGFLVVMKMLVKNMNCGEIYK
ncbi:MAG: Na+/H+ antiporter NhaC family protein [Lachnospiraceae bacterium]|nr:Na+/H+ antiporter NhaC family protein [Lachnospiraceae bacterium]